MNNKDEILYIITSKTYARSNRFIVGGVKSLDMLNSRLSKYNSGVNEDDDRMYVCFVTECSRVEHLEERISDLLSDHIIADNMIGEGNEYNMHYKDLVFMIETIVSHYNYEIDEIAEHIKKMQIKS